MPKVRHADQDGVDVFARQHFAEIMEGFAVASGSVMPVDDTGEKLRDVFFINITGGDYAAFIQIRERLLCPVCLDFRSRRPLKRRVRKERWRRRGPARGWG